MTSLDQWTAHTPMSDPGGLARTIAAFPDEVAHLAGIVQGLLVHSSWLGASRQVPPDELAWLDDLAARPDQPLVARRPDWLD
jgi:hypothetical protein